ncbi:hypothetical protein BTURTLESOX_1713 [bacterium endosymbiont of Bathymodiolus sp. 5 South]|nr:hypothetical protein BTURTLESOX_1713 [bacterium endosymbiont of Bathymodiolus sp. 5 South]
MFVRKENIRDLCINMNNHQNAKLAKLVILLIIPTYAKVSIN